MNRNVWPARVLTVALVAVLALVGTHAWLGRTSVTRGEWLQVALLTALVLVTMYYARATERQAAASVEMAKASLRPVIVLGRQETMARGVGAGRPVERQERVTGNTSVYNAGSGPAVNLRFLLVGPDRFHAMVVEEHPGLTALGPGEMFWLSLRQCYEKMGWVSHDLCVEYEDVAGRRWRSGLALKREEGKESFSVEGLFCENITLGEGAMRRLKEWFRSCRREKGGGGLSGK